MICQKEDLVLLDWDSPQITVPTDSAKPQTAGKYCTQGINQEPINGLQSPRVNQLENRTFYRQLGKPK